MLGLTLLQFFWLSQFLLTLVWFLYLVSQGDFFDKTFGERDPDAPFGILQFRKRPAIYLFVSLVVNLWCIWNLTWTCFGYEPSTRFHNVLTYFGAEGSTGTDPLHALIALLLYEFYLGRHYYETLSVCVFSGRQTYSLIMVVLLFLACLGAPLSIVAEVDFQQLEFHCFSLSNLTWRPLVAVPLFLWANKLQHAVAYQLAKLRKNKAGHVVTSSYKMPKGEWFEKVSSPHYFAEIVIYISMGVLLGCGSVTWWLFAAYCSSIILVMAYSTHTWYLQKFSEYPKERKIIIPYLY